MAVANPTVLTTTTSTSTITTLQTASVSPTANGLIVVIASVVRSATPAPTSFSVTDTFAGTGAWTINVTEPNASNTQATMIATARAGSAPGSGTITVSWTNTGTRTVLEILDVATGSDTTTPVPHTGVATGTAATLAITLNGSPASDSLVIGAVTSVNASGVTPGSGFTELIESTIGSGPNNRTEVEYINGGATTTVDWSGLATSSNTAAAIEIAAAGAATKAPPPMQSRWRRQPRTRVA